MSQTDLLPWSVLHGDEVEDVYDDFITVFTAEINEHKGLLLPACRFFAQNQGNIF